MSFAEFLSSTFVYHAWHACNRFVVVMSVFHFVINCGIAGHHGYLFSFSSFALFCISFVSNDFLLLQ